MELYRTQNMFCVHIFGCEGGFIVPARAPAMYLLSICEIDSVDNFEKVYRVHLASIDKM